MNKDLIYGKANQTRIVGMEDVGDGTMELFIQNYDGTISTKTELHNYWFLSSEQADEQSIELQGNGYYKYRNNFSLREDFDFAKKQLYKYKNKCFWINDPKEQFMVQAGHTYFKGLKHNEVSVLSFDIETTGIELNKDSKVLIISNTFRDCFGKIERKMFTYDNYTSPKEMLLAWCNWINEIDPSIIISHNGYTFDIPFLEHIAKLHNIELTLGRRQKAIQFNKWPSKFRKDGSQFIEYTKFNIYGRSFADTFQIAIKYDVNRNFQSYALKSLINELGLEKKDRQFYDASKIRHNYKNKIEWEKIKKYAEFDADDALALWDLMGSAFFYSAQYIPKGFSDILTSASGSQINSILIRAYMQLDYSLPKASEIKKFQGGVSFGIPGIYRNCWKLDIKSCYPSAVLINKLYSKEKDPFGFMYEICEYFTNQRFEYKKKYKETQDEYWSAMDAAAKIFINSIFGFCGASGLLFNEPDIAAKITEYGRHYLNQGILWATGKDSNYWSTYEKKI